MKNREDIGDIGEEGDSDSTGAEQEENDIGLTVREFALLTGKSYTTIRSMVANSGDLPAKVVGKGGRNSPKYLIDQKQLSIFGKTPKLIGRPRKSDL